MNKQLTLGSLFDGSGGFPLAGMMCGIEPIWASEIEPFPICVTTKRIPQMKHYGDITKMHGSEIEPVDIITFGSSCQNLLISAGKSRTGLNGEKSSMFFEAIRVIKEMRCATHGKYPRYICWENIFGALSSHGWRDFKSVLDAVCQIKDETASVPEPPKGKWTNAGEIVGDDYSVAWCVFDTQHHGLPQRRVRIILVADFDGGSAGKILFESKSLPWNTPKKHCARQETAGGTGESAETPGGLCLNDQGGQRMDVTENITSTLRAESHHPPCILHSAGFCTEHSEHSRGIGYEEEISPTLRAGTVPAAQKCLQDWLKTNPQKLLQKT